MSKEEFELLYRVSHLVNGLLHTMLPIFIAILSSIVILELWVHVYLPSLINETGFPKIK